MNLLDCGGVDSSDSDVDLRGCHVLPLEQVVGIDAPPLTLEPKTGRDSTEVERRVDWR
jgi:predicted nucleotidyltransferase